MKIKFSKMHGAGNDFMVINCVNQTINFTKDKIKRLADRNFGVGFDQLLLLKPIDNLLHINKSVVAEFFYQIFNNDGNEVFQCGNGARCLAKFIGDNNLSQSNPITVQTKLDYLQLHIVDKDTVSINMGYPQFTPSKIPICIDELSLENNEYVLKNTQAGTINFSAVSMGNPHAVIRTDDIEAAPIEIVGCFLQDKSKCDIFPVGVNVNFVEIITRNIVKLRVLERGVGETLACGSGACATVASLRQLGLVDSRVKVKLLGGELELQWDNPQQPIIMIGPATTVYQGEIEIS